MQESDLKLGAFAMYFFIDDANAEIILAVENIVKSLLPEKWTHEIDWNADGKSPFGVRIGVNYWKEADHYRTENHWTFNEAEPIPEELLVINSPKLIQIRTDIITAMKGLGFQFPEEKQITQPSNDENNKELREALELFLGKIPYEELKGTITSPLSVTVGENPGEIKVLMSHPPIYWKDANNETRIQLTMIAIERLIRYDPWFTRPLCNDINPGGPGEKLWKGWELPQKELV